jgi:hypothetical protein
MRCDDQANCTFTCSGGGCQFQCNTNGTCNTQCQVDGGGGCTGP